MEVRLREKVDPILLLHRQNMFDSRCHQEQFYQKVCSHSAILVNFWATWCPPCLSEIPELSNLHDAHKTSNLVVIGVAIDSGSSSKVASFAEEHGISYPIVAGNRKIVSQIGELKVLPTSYLYAPNGKQVSFHEGEVTEESINTYIKNKKFN